MQNYLSIIEEFAKCGRYQSGSFNSILCSLLDNALENGVAYTTKADKSLHGIGLKCVEKTVKKYNGTFEYYTKDSNEESYFIAEAMLYSQYP